MGRSVMTVPDATATAYDRFTPQHYCDTCDDFCEEHQDELFCDAYCDHSEDFHDYLDWVAETAQRLWPSLSDADSWIGNEVHVIAENDHSVIGVAEYCGSVSISLAPRYDRADYWRDPEPALGEHWRKQISEKFLATFGEMTKIATLSDGTSIYRLDK